MSTRVSNNDYDAGMRLLSLVFGDLPSSTVIQLPHREIAVQVQSLVYPLAELDGGAHKVGELVACLNVNFGGMSS